MTSCTTSFAPRAAAAWAKPTLRLTGIGVAVAALCSTLATDVAALEWRLEVEGLASGQLAADRMTVARSSDGDIHGALEELTIPVFGRLGTFRLSCQNADRPCGAGRLERRPTGSDVPEALHWQRSKEGIDFFAEVEADPVAGLRRASSGWLLEFDGFDLADWVRGADGAIEFQAAMIRGQARFADEGAVFDLQLQPLDFDTADGASAGAGLALGLRGQWTGPSLDAALEWTAGEALFGPAYLPSPPAPIRFALRHAIEAGGAHHIALRLDGESLLSGEATAIWAGDREDDRLIDGLQQLRGRVDVAALAGLWPLGLESLAAGAGWPGLLVDGRFSAGLDWQAGGVQQLEIDLDEVVLEDPAGRLAIDGLSTQLQRTREGDRIALAFDHATVYRLPLGPTRIDLAGSVALGDGLSLVEPARIPLLDGALWIDRLLLRSSERGGPRIALDAEIEPLSLAALTERLGWPRFGGRLSGRFPGLQLDRDVFRVAGGLDLELFDGTARIADLAIERPFGPLTALTGTLTFERLDLEPLTSAFDFGAMQGSLSGHLRDVRLLDWQPVAFDAWFYTPVDARRTRRISQRAVDQIASLGGGGAAALSAPLLSLFDDFGYTQVGLGCRLAQSVCTMRGLEDVEGGGYRIVEGRGLPRLDVVGFRRRVDWPVLLAQLEAATRGEGPTTGN